LDRLTWAGVGVAHSSYYWAHLLLAVALVTGFCYVVYQELLYYIQIRHRYLSSVTSATTVFILGIPPGLRSVNALSAIYNNVGAGVRTVSLNRNCEALYKKLQERDKIVARICYAEP